MAAENRQVIIRKIIRETHDTSSFLLQPISGHLEAKSGQFVTFTLKSYAGTEIRRSYSLSSSPELNEPLTVTVKRVPNGEVSRKFLDQFCEGEVLNTIGASGMFVLPANMHKYQTFFFFAAGSGITPIFSLIKTLLHFHRECRAILVYSNRNIAETIFYRQLKELEVRYASTFELHLLFSISTDLSRSRLTPTLLESFLSNYQVNFRNSLFYLCGPGDYMRMTYYTLMSLGVQPGRVRRETFFVQQPKVIPVPADTSPHKVTLISKDDSFTFTVQYPESILNKARSLNIPLSFSCETGQCGTCVAKCLQGEVWMSRNEILLDEELQQGSVLTCTGYPVNGDVTLKI